MLCLLIVAQLATEVLKSLTLPASIIVADIMSCVAMPLGRLPLFSICQEMPCGSIEDGDDRDSHGRAFGHVMSTLFHRQSTSKGHRTFDRKAWMEGLERQGKTWLLKCITGFVGVQVSECSSTAKWDGVNDPESSQPPDLPV